MSAQTGPIRPAGRVEAVSLENGKPATLTGARGLLQDEKLIFELNAWNNTGVDLPEPELDASDLGDLVRTARRIAHASARKRAAPAGR